MIMVAKFSALMSQRVGINLGILFAVYVMVCVIDCFSLSFEHVKG